MAKRSRRDEESNLEVSEEECDVDDDEMDDEEEDEALDQTVQLELEGRKPESHHYSGIGRLLRQLFLKMDVNVPELTNFIIKQTEIGSVLQQLEPSDDEDDDEADDMDYGQDGDAVVMSVTTVVNITAENETEFVKQLKKVVLQKSKASGAKQANELEGILNSVDHQVGFLINERMLGLPPQVAIFESLWKDVEKAKRSGENYNFSYYLLLSKTLRPMKTSKKNKKVESVERHFVNEEEQLFFRNSLMSFDFSVRDQSDTALAGNWDDEDEDESYEPMRTIMIVAADKIPTIMSEIASLSASATAN